MSDLSKRLGNLPDSKKALLAALLRERRGAQSQSIPRRDPGNPAPLSFAQRRFWFLAKLVNDHGFYNVPIVIRLAGALDRDAVARALSDVVRRHEILRTTYRLDGDEPAQIVAPAGPVAVAFEDLASLPASERERVAVERASEDAALAFHLESGPVLRARLLRLSAEEHILAVVIHHIATDGRSTEILFREFAAAYDAAANTRELQLPELSIQYADYSEWQARRWSAEQIEQEVGYWRDALAGADEPLDLPTDWPRAAVPSHRGGRERRLLSAQLADRLGALATEEGATRFMVLLAGFAALLYRYTGKPNVFVGTPVANRDRGELEPLIGCFANTMVLRTNTAGNPSFRELIRRVRDTATSAYDHQEMPFEKIVEHLHPERHLAQNPLFQVMFVYQKVEDSPIAFAGLRCERVDIHNRTAKFDLDFSLLDGPNGIDAALEYNADLFSARRIRRQLGHYERLLEELVRNPDQGIGDAVMLSDAELHAAAREWNATEEAFPSARCLHQLFEEWTRKTPDAPAVLTAGGSVDYGSLNRRANQLARYLRGRGVGRNTIVAIAVERTADFALGLLAILKAGGAYLPLDPGQIVEQRLKLMLHDSGALLILTQRRTTAVVASAGVETVALEDIGPALDALPDDDLDPIARPTDLCYVIYTSGSTGQPKGVLLDHRGRVSNFTDFNRRFDVGSSDRVLSISSLGFDMSAYDVLGTLAAGAALVMPDPERQRDLEHWLALMEQHRVTIWHSVPALLGLLIDTMSDENTRALSHLRVVLLGGDWIPVTLPDRLRAHATRAVVISLGGATEVSMDSTIYAIEAVDPAWRSIPYGRPMANQRAYVIDERGGLAPIGVPGELCLGGIGLAWGYGNGAALTAQKFIPNPYSGKPGDRMYRTGDLARYMEDGTLELLGRIDFQVKIRGNRVELGEIETALRETGGIEAVVVVAREQDRRKILVAYVVPEAGVELSVDALREQLRARLPDYMVPSAFMILPALPLTPNGKVDRGRLPAPSAPAQAANTAQRRPSTATEQALAAIWEELLGVRDVPVDESFFALGGDSIGTIRMATRARQVGLTVTPKLLFQHQTIAALAAAIEGAAASTAGVDGSPAMHAAEDARGPYELGPMQRNMHLRLQSAPRPGLYVIQSAFPLPGDLDIDAFASAWRLLIQRHSILRTAYQGAGTALPMQVVLPDADLPLIRLDWRGRTAEQQERELRDELARQRAHGFELASAPLLRLYLVRLSDDAHLFVQLHHYSILDGWSCFQLRKELLIAYRAILAGEEPRLPATRPFRDYVQWLATQDRDGAIAYWRSYLRDFEQPTSPVSKLASPAGDADPLFDRTASTLDPAVASGLDAAARRLGVTFAALVQIAWAVLLARRTGLLDVVFGVTSSGRPASLAGVEGMIGTFINTVPVRVRLDRARSLADAARALQAKRAEADEQAFLDLPTICDERELFDSVLVFDNYPVDESLRAVGQIDATPSPLLTADLGVAQTEFRVRVDVWHGAQDALVVSYYRDAVADEEAEALACELAAILAAIAAAPDTTMDALLALATEGS